MSCCGSKRRSWTNSSTPLPADNSAPSAPVFLRFRYTGTRSLAVTGGITGQIYRFLQNGAEVLIDRRDVAGMYAVPNVERAPD